MDARAGAALGRALAALRDQINARLDALEAKEPAFNVPVPSVQVGAAEIDLAPISEALMAFADLVSAEREANIKANVAIADAINAMSNTILAQNDRVGAMGTQLEVAVAQLTAAMTAPKTLVFDDDGEPVGLIVGDRQKLN